MDVDVPEGTQDAGHRVKLAKRARTCGTTCELFYRAIVDAIDP